MSHSSSSERALADYGWDEERERSFTAYRAKGLVPGRVIGVDRGRCDVVTEHGAVRAGTSLVRSADPVELPCTGDWAALRPGRDPELAALLPRRGVIVRSAVSRSSHGQALAANVDVAAVVVSAAVDVKPGRVERLLALAWEGGALPVVVLTKIDESADLPWTVAEVRRSAPGVEVVPTSAVTGEGIDALQAVLTGTVVLLGPSGAGKSTLGNALLGAAVLETGAVRAQDNKGRHTTVRRQMVRLPNGGVLIDTPGLRGVGLLDAEEGLRRTFADVEELARDCRFGDCGHESEPGCAVLAAIAEGALDQRRLDGYRRLQRENAWAASRADARLRKERADRWKAITKSARAAARDRRR
ncbi:ribosome small subunit-dependent GTPase A [Actinoallomurus sp. NPDC052308]|uniref:ribosome small subunit-dependent GTPase A n=1 Tax=Actinoallomurus sp. NPDC052308 TaxID=3155530 RepID=UPI003420785A